MNPTGMTTTTTNANSTMSSSSSSPTAAAVPSPNHLEKREPDPDAIKMFCGQIPRNMQEVELREMFEQFGPVFQLNVLRDKQTGESKGCCFVTFYSRRAALDAQNALHNLRTLPGSHHPIQMKPADTENRNERKLFVGMVSKNYDEQNIRALFQSYGAIEDCTVLRDANGKSRGCAFVTFQKRQCALNAIKSMHQSQTMEGCSSPLVVKFADTPKDKETKKIQQQYTAHNNTMMQHVPPGNSMPSPQHLNAYNFMPELGNLVFLQQLLKTYGFLSNNGNAINLAALNNLLQMFANNMNLNGNKPPLLPAPPTGPSAPMNINLNSQHGSNQSLNLPEQQQQQQQHSLNSPRSTHPANSNPTAYNNESSLLMCATGAYSSAGPSPNNPSAPPTNHHPANGGLSSAVSTAGNGSYPAAPMASLYPNSAASPLSNGGADALHNLQNLVAMSQVNNTGSFPIFPSGSYLSSQVAGKHTEGPDGANLFIYHLPQEYSDTDLAQAFAPFGPIISAKVFVDKTTNRSKCFGFVSYDNPASAQAAINQMNGYQIGMKRLKVQLKKLRTHPSNSNSTQLAAAGPVSNSSSNTASASTTVPVPPSASTTPTTTTTTNHGPNTHNGNSPTTPKKSSY